MEESGSVEGLLARLNEAGIGGGRLEKEAGVMDNELGRCFKVRRQNTLIETKNHPRENGTLIFANSR